MGTRADFYVGRGADAEWLGSIAWDGYPKGIPSDLFNPLREEIFREKVASFLAGREDKTLPEQGWPWPWETSATTDYAYAFDREDCDVYASCFGGAWYDPRREMSEEREKLLEMKDKAVFPDMSRAKQREKFGAHSGVLLIGMPK